jgi:lipopolysaccharide/colanic/teichoic acid biosynthesis glycosyltransferase
MNTNVETSTETMTISETLLQRSSPRPKAASSTAAGVGELCYRLFEFGFAAAVLIATLPIMLVIGLLIKLGTKGPVLFFQERLGKDGKPFKFVKFRTMHTDARQRFPELYRYQYSDNEIEKLVFKITNDPRLTPQGRWLRRTSLDELPNFWNVLTGDMALVGPRPEIPEMFKYYTGDMVEKFSVRPGVTGLAQISGRGHLRFCETAEFDLQYVRERSLPMDIGILFKSLQAVSKATGAF